MCRRLWGQPHVAPIYAMLLHQWLLLHKHAGGAEQRLKHLKVMVSGTHYAAAPRPHLLDLKIRFEYPTNLCTDQCSRRQELSCGSFSKDAWQCFQPGVLQRKLYHSFMRWISHGHCSKHSSGPGLAWHGVQGRSWLLAECRHEAYV